MVYQNPPLDRDFAHFYGDDPMNVQVLSGSENMAAAGMDDPNKKIRKPYTITKSRESWTDQEHEKFIEALHLFDRDWKKIEAFVGSKTVIQIRSHAQKYFLKVQKNGSSEHVPPPRPKRKAPHPYSQKAAKNAALLENEYGEGCDSLPVSGNPVSDAPLPLSSWNYKVVPTGFLPHAPKDDIGLATVPNNFSSRSNESSNPRVEKSDEMHCQVNPCNNTTRAVMPDFAQVYRFIGSVFDPSASDHMHNLKKMDPISVETVLMLMKNLSVNLVSPEFEDHRRLLSSYN